jgi:hypothetical protein
MTGSSLLSFHPTLLGKNARVQLDGFEEVLQLADDLASYRPVPYPVDWIDGYAEFQSNATHDIPALAVFGALSAASKAALETQAIEQQASADYSAKCSAEVHWVVHSIPAEHMSYSDEHILEIRRDYELLLDCARKQGWNDETPVPQELFSVYADFKSPLDRGDRHIIEVGNLFTEKLLGDFRKYPHYLYSLSPRRFEELIAKLWDGFGYTVELTKRTRDGGYDVVAIGNNLLKTKYIIECKRYRKDASVGVGFVRQLHGVVDSKGVTKGVLATTGSFTASAVEHLKLHPWLLEGKDFEGVVSWLNEYQRFCLKQTGTLVG